ncbi:unnamed protein product [Euphydryas editha]|uniref:Nuclease HARBI1 n=1 Tax=Euphydryas editha TaxID=104508 RepID=A0AAU9TSI7_EUPED|nr:unnamed protein product [Euphydryas editha]
MSDGIGVVHYERLCKNHIISEETIIGDEDGGSGREADPEYHKNVARALHLVVSNVLAICHSEYNDDEEEIEGARENRHNVYNDSNRKFVSNYRLTKELAKILIEILWSLVVPSRRLSDLPIEIKVLTALNFFAKGFFHKNSKVSQGTVSNCIIEVVKALNHLSVFGYWVKFPRNISEMKAVSQRVYRLHSCRYPLIYVNRKRYHSINTQLICDTNLCIINVNALTGRYYLIGDSGYPLRPWLHTPIPEPLPGPEENYNKAFKSASFTIERCN